MDMDNVVIQLHAGEYHDFVRYLIAMDFRRVVLDTPPWRFKTLGQLLRQYTSGLLQLLVHLRSVRGLGTVIVFSHFAFVVKLLARLGLMRYENLFCFGFFVHDPKWFPLFRWLVRLDRANDHYIIFSESEVGALSGGAWNCDPAHALCSARRLAPDAIAGATPASE